MPLLFYFLTTFIISWGGMLILGLPYGFPASQSDFTSNWPIVFIPYLLGPLLSSIITNTVFYKQKTWNAFGVLFKGKKVPIYLPIVSILALPLIVILVLSILSLFSSNYNPKILSEPNAFGVVLMGLSIGLFGGGFLEEPGWTAFATNRMKNNKNSILKTSIIIGFVWGLWHILPTAWGCGDINGRFDFMLFLPPLVFYVGILPVYRAIMTIIFYKYENIYISILMHMSLTASTLFIIVPKAIGIELVIYYLILSLVLSFIMIILKRNINLTTASS